MKSYSIIILFAVILCLTGVNTHIGYAQSSDTDLETFFGLSPRTLDSLGFGNVTDGSGIQITHDFGQSPTNGFSFSWNFLTNKSTPDTNFNDGAFVVIDGVVTNFADTNSTFIPSPPSSSFAEETGFSTFNGTTLSGSHTIGFGVVNAGDTGVQSGLLVDNIFSVANGGFEQGDFSGGWSTIGSAAVTGSIGFNGPVEGTFQAFLNTLDSATGTEVPEPSTTALFALVILGLGMVSRRYRKVSPQNRL